MLIQSNNVGVAELEKEGQCTPTSSRVTIGIK